MQVADIHKQFLDITNEDVQHIIENSLKGYHGPISILFLDCSYLYNFHLDDFEQIRKMNLLMRRNPLHVREWHRLLERWYNDHKVNGIKPIQIERSFDRVVNEGLGVIANGIVGREVPAFEFRSIGDGVVPQVYPSDQILVNQIDRINVNTTANGGSLSVDGTTIYSIGNHSKTIATADLTECGMHDTADPSTDRMLDHSAFSSPIEHVQNSDAPGSTTIIYMCSV